MVVVAYGNLILGAGPCGGKNGLPAGDNGSGSGKELGDQLLGDVFRVFLCFNLSVVCGFFKKKTKILLFDLPKFWNFAEQKRALSRSRYKVTPRSDGLPSH